MPLIRRARALLLQKTARSQRMCSCSAYMMGTLWRMMTRTQVLAAFMRLLSSCDWHASFILMLLECRWCGHCSQRVRKGRR